MNEIIITLSRDTVHILAAITAVGFALFAAWLNWWPPVRQAAHKHDWAMVAGGCGLIGLHLLLKHGEALFLSYLGSLVLFGLPMTASVLLVRWSVLRRERIEAEARRIQDSR